MNDLIGKATSLGSFGLTRRALVMPGVLIGLLGGGVVSAQTAAQPPAGYPAWAQPAPAANYPAPGQEGGAPPPGPYTAPAPGQPDQSAAGFAPPGYGNWAPGQRSNGGGMNREEFLKQQAARREAMQQQMQQPPAGAPAGQPPAWPDMDQQRQAHEQRRAEMQAQQEQRRQAHEQRWAEMQTQHQQRMQQGNWPPAQGSAPGMPQPPRDVQARREAHWKEFQAREKEMNRLWEQMQAEHQKMREQFEQMRRERYGQPQAAAPGSTQQQAPQSAAPQQDGSAQAAPQMPGRAAPYGYPGPYGQAPWQTPGYPYGPPR